MAGGFGTRLRPLTNKTPKPMVPIIDKPILEHLISLLKIHDITDYTILLYYQPEIIQDYFKDGSRFGVKIKYVVPDADYGTAGAVKLSEQFIKDNFLVISGDVLTDFDLSALRKFHEDKKAQATISLYSSENPLQFGIVLTDKDKRIVRFLEKPSSSEVFSDTINTGIYFFNKDIFKYIPERENFDFSQDLFPLLLKENIPIYGYRSEGYWRDVGNLEEYISANLDALSGKLHFIKEKDYYGNFISKNTKIGRNVNIENSIINDGCELGDDIVIRNSVIWKDVKIDSRTNILFDVICSNCTIGQNTRINDYVFIGENCTIGKNVFISSSIKIWDNKKIDNNVKITKSLIYEDRFFNELYTDSRISGLSNIQINPEFAAKLGSVYGAFIGTGKNIIIARDIDDISNMIKRALSSGILSAGVDVVDLQVIPIPILRQELKSGSGSGGIFVRKSPFDKEVTDIIFFDKDGLDLSGNKTKSVERLFFGEDYRRAPYFSAGTIRYPERTNQKYKEQFLSNIDVEALRKRKFKIVIDYSYGIAATIFPGIIGEFGVDVVSLSAHLDKDKITRSYAEIREALGHASFVVKSLDYDLGFMIDAGGEKIWMLTVEGRSLTGDRFLVLITKLFLSQTPGVKKIAVPVQATGEIEIVAQEYGVEVVRVKDSHYALMSACNDKDVRFAGGVRGGFIFPDFLYATDGMFSVAKILELLARGNTTIGELDKSIPELCMQKEDIVCSREDKGKIMRKFMEDTMQNEQQLIDGVKVFLNGNNKEWVLCIPDKVKDVVHLYVETDSDERSGTILNSYKKKVQSYLTQ